VTTRPPTRAPLQEEVPSRRPAEQGDGNGDEGVDDGSDDDQDDERRECSLKDGTHRTSAIGSEFTGVHLEAEEAVLGRRREDNGGFHALTTALAISTSATSIALSLTLCHDPNLPAGAGPIRPMAPQLQR